MYQFCQINENPEMLSASEDAGDDELALRHKLVSVWEALNYVGAF